MLRALDKHTKTTQTNIINFKKENKQMDNSIQNKVNHRIIMPLQGFLRQEKSGGIVLGLSVIVALILANSPWAGSYFHFFEQKLGIAFNGSLYMNYSLHHWVNDGLMAMFFFVVGLELKREFIGGELSDIKNTILPICAAIGGMVVPALIYISLNVGDATANGWGIPMATDIAFSLGILCLLGSKVPTSIKVFLTTLAIVDDLGAVLVIALFYTSEISVVNILIGLLFLLVMFIANKLGVKNVIFYAVLGIGGVWTSFLLSGVHATIAAVLSAFMIPADSRIPESIYISRANKLLQRFRKAKPNDVSTLEEDQLDILDRTRREAKDAIPPLQRLELAMHPFISFVIMPIFALSNAGISFSGINASTLLSTNVAAGVMLGLLFGKPIGIIGSTVLLTKLRIATPPKEMTFRKLVGLGFLASIGFTMSMFVSTLAFDASEHFTQSMVGIFAASIVGGAIGYFLLKKE
jgi:NhaA family Na+:H+ antiporter